MSVTGPVSYQVKTKDGLVVRRPVKRRHTEGTLPVVDTQSDDEWTTADRFYNKPIPPTNPQPSHAPVLQVPIRRSTRSRPPVDLERFHHQLKSAL